MELSSRKFILNIIGIVVKNHVPKYDAPNTPDPIPEPLAFLMNPEGDVEQYRAPAKPVIEPLLFEKPLKLRWITQILSATYTLPTIMHGKRR
jgi:hypothetical protein